MDELDPTAAVPAAGLLEGIARLASAATEVEVAEAVLEACLHAVRADGGVVYHVDAAQRFLPLARMVAPSSVGETGRTDRRGGSLVEVPISQSDRLVGLIELSFDEPRQLDVEESGLLETVAHQAGVALGGVRRREADRKAVGDAAAAAARTAALYRVTQAFSRAVTVHDVIEAALDAMVEVLRADSMIVVQRVDAQYLQRIGMRGLAEPPDAVERLYRLDEHRPLSASARDGRARWYASRDEIAAEFGPDHALPAFAQSGCTAPLVIDNEPIGAIAVSFNRPGAVDPADRDLLTALATLCSEALRRARLYEEEQRASARRLALYSATQAFAGVWSEHDALRTTLTAVRSVAGEGGSAIACLLDADGVLRGVELLAGAGEINARSFAGARGLGLSQVAIDGRAIHHDTPDELWADLPALRTVLPEFGSGAIVPISVDARSVGALAVWHRTAHRIDQADRELFISLATLCGERLRRLELLEEERRTQRRTLALHRVTEAFSRSVTIDEVMRAALGAAIETLQPLSCATMMVDADGSLRSWRRGGDGTLADAQVRFNPAEVAQPVRAMLADGRARFYESAADAVAEFPDVSLYFRCAAAHLPLLVDGEVTGTLGVRFRGDRPISTAERELLGSLAALCGEAVRRAHLFEEERRATARALALHRLSAAFASVDGIEAILEAVITCGKEALAPLAVVAGLVEGDWLRVVALRDLAGPDLFPGARLPLDAHRGLCATARDGNVRWLGSRQEIAAEFGEDYPGSPLIHAAAILPLTEADATVGVLAVTFDEPHRFEPADRELLETMAELCSQALRRARLADEERRAASRTAALHRVTEAFSRSVTIDEVIDAATAALLDTLDARACGALVIDNQSRLRHWRRVGSGALVSGSLDRHRLGMPHHAVLNDARSRYFADAAAVTAEFYDVAVRWTAEAGALVPLIIDGEAAGMVEIEFDDAHPFPAADRALMETLASLCAEAVRRARLFEEERRSAVRNAKRREISEAFSRAASVEEVLEEVTKAVADLLQPTTVAVYLERRGGLAMSKVWGVPYAREAFRALPHEDQTRPVAATFADGVARWFATEVDAAVEFGFNYDPAKVFFRAGATIPMRSEGSVLGVIGVGFADHRIVDPGDRELLESVATAAAEALRRARSYEAERRAAARAIALHRLTGAFATVTTVDEVLAAAVEEVHATLGALSTMASLVHAEGDAPGAISELRAAAGRVDRAIGRRSPLRGDGRLTVSSALLAGEVRWVDADGQEADDLPIGPVGPHGEALWRSGGMLPLLVGDEVVGCLVVSFERAGGLAAADRELLETVAGLCSAALGRARDFEQTREAAQRYQSLFDSYEQLFRHNPQPLLVFAGKASTILAANDALLAAFGYDAAELAELTFPDLLPPGLRQGFDARLAELTQPGHAAVVDAGLVPMQRKDGTTFIAEVYGHEARLFAGQRANVALLVDQTAGIQAAAERRRLQERVAAVAEEERRRIAADLHDGPVQQLSIAAMRLSALRRSLPSDGGPLTGRVITIEEDVLRTVEELRSMMQRLYPPALDVMSLAEAIRGAVVDGVLPHGATGADAAVQVRIEDHLAGPLPSGVKAALYRVVMEALTNVHKHAKAREVVIDLTSDEDHAEVRIEDDGIGIVPADALRLRPGHLGLASMQDRISLLGGSCSVSPGARGGTVVLASVPLPD